MGQNRGKQFNLSKREALSRMIRDKKTAKEIAAALGMDPTSVSREVMGNRRKSAPGLDDDTACRGCEYRIGCAVHHVCGRKECGLRCASCKAMRSCPRFSPFRCPVERRWPLCCNGCPKERRCPLDHWHYLPDEADSAARERLSESRSGADMTPGELKAMDEALREAVVVRGQSIHHALLANETPSDAARRRPTAASPLGSSPSGTSTSRASRASRRGKEARSPTDTPTGTRIPSTGRDTSTRTGWSTATPTASPTTSRWTSSASPTPRARRCWS
jgi:hypothetical protein